MCAVTIMSPLFTHKSSIFGFCMDEKWISSMQRKCVLLSPVLKGVPSSLYVERRGTFLPYRGYTPAKHHICKPGRDLDARYKFGKVSDKIICSMNFGYVSQFLLIQSVYSERRCMLYKA